MYSEGLKLIIRLLHGQNHKGMKLSQKMPSFAKGGTSKFVLLQIEKFEVFKGF